MRGSTTTAGGGCGARAPPRAGVPTPGYKGGGRNRGWNGVGMGVGRHFGTRLEWGLEGGWNAHSATSRWARDLLTGPLFTIRILPACSRLSIAALSARLVMPSDLGWLAKIVGA